MFKHKKYIFDFNETYLCEGSFDDMFGDDETNDDSLLGDIISTQEDTNDIMLKSFSKDLLKKMQEAFDNSLEERRWSKIEYVLQINDNHLFILDTNDEGTFRINNTRYIHVDVKYVDEFNKFINFAYQAGIDYIDNVFIKIENPKRNLEAEESIVDFQNISVDAMTLINVTPKNIHIEETRDQAAYTRQGIFFKSCNLTYQDTFNIKAKYIEIENCINIKDFSFVAGSANILENIEITVVEQKHMSSTCNLTGLPEGNYKLYLKVGPEGIYRGELFDKVNNFVGVPETCSFVKFYARHNPTTIMPWWSFEGLSDDIITNHLDTCISGFKGRVGGTIIQFGPNIVEPKVIRYSLTTPIIRYITSTHDYYVDCYKKSDGPTKEYKPSEDLQNSKAYVNVGKQVDKKKKQMEEDEEDFQKMVKLAKKILEEKVLYRSIHNREYMLRIENIFDDKVKYTVSSKYRIWTYTQTWKEFLNFLKNNNFQTADEKQLLWAAISEPIIKFRKRKKAKEKADAKLQRQQEREEAKQRAKEEKQNKKKQIIDTEEVAQAVSDKIMGKTKEPEENITPVQNNNDTLPIVHNGISIVEYSDKSVALFGNTYPIKDQIKELGAKFNKFLKDPDNEDNKKPGWIISKSKLNDIKKIIGI